MVYTGLPNFTSVCPPMFNIIYYVLMVQTSENYELYINPLQGGNCLGFKYDTEAFISLNDTRINQINTSNKFK